MRTLLKVMVCLTLVGCEGTGPGTSRPFEGRIVFQSDRSGVDRIYTMRLDGSEVEEFPIPLEGPLTDPDVSPDGRKLAFENYGEIYSIDAEGTNLRNLTRFPAFEHQPRWSPTGAQIAFRSTRSGNGDIFTIVANGTGLVQVTQDERAEFLSDWSPDGSRLLISVADPDAHNLYVVSVDGTSRDPITTAPEGGGEASWSSNGDIVFLRNFRNGLFIMKADGSNQRALVESDQSVYHAAWSPDGSQVAFVRIESGNPEIAVVNADGTGLVELTAHPGVDLHPVWGPEAD